MNSIREQNVPWIEVYDLRIFISQRTGSRNAAALHWYQAFKRDGKDVDNAELVTVFAGRSRRTKFAIPAIETFDWTLPDLHTTLKIGVMTSLLEILHQISKIVSSGLELDQMLRELVHLAVEVTNCDACLIYLAEPDGEVVLRASQIPHSAEIGNIRIKPGEGVTGWVAEHRAVVALASKAATDKRFKNFPALVEDTFEALLSVPLVSGGDVIGVINVHHKRAHAHAPEEVALLTFMGEQMGGAISKSRLTEENARLQEETL